MYKRMSKSCPGESVMPLGLEEIPFAQKQSTGEAYVILSSGTNTSGTVDARQATIPWLSQLYSGTNLAGSITSMPSGTQDVDIGHGSVYDSSSTAIRVIEVAPSGTAVTENVRIVGQTYIPIHTRIYSGTNAIGYLYGNASSVNAVQGTRPWDSILHSGTNLAGTVVSRCVQITSPWQVSGTVISSPSGTQDVHVISGTTHVLQATTPWVTQLHSGTNVAGTVDVRQATTPWLARLHSGTNVAGTFDARCTQVTTPWTVRSDTSSTARVVQVTTPWIVSGTVISTPSGTQDVDIVGQSYTPLRARTDSSSTANVLQRTTPWLTQLYAGTNVAGTVDVRQATSPWVVQTSVSSTANVVQVTSPWVSRTDSSSTANVVQRTTPWISRLSSGTNVAGTVDARCTQVTSPWVVSQSGTWSTTKVGSSLTGYNTVNVSTSATMVLPQDLNRSVAIFRNDGTNNVRFGGLLVSASRGMLVQGGEVFNPTVTSAVYAIGVSYGSTIGYWTL